MNIGLDIDGCMSDFSQHLKDLLKNEYRVESVETTNYHMLSQIGIHTVSDQKKFFYKHKDYFNKFEPKLNCAKVISLLNNEHKVYIMTARSYDEAKETENWLRKNLINIDNIYFNCENKVGACLWKNIDVMVEDSPYNAIELAEKGIKVLLMNADYNKDIKHKNITRCYSWNEVFFKIKEM